VTIVIITGPPLQVADGMSLMWAVSAGLVLVVLAVSAFRVVPEGERLVVFRFGRVVAVKRPGLAAMLPGLDRGVRVSLGAAYVDIFWLEAVTRDGVNITVNGAVLASVRDPISYALHPGSPNSATLVAAEEEIRGYVAERDLAELVEPSEEDRRDLSAAISDRTRVWGVEVSLTEVSRVEVRLKADLIRWAEGFDDRTRRARRTS
jgi:regulator of protease activity HflC (stomatin/prohibitin superfamily)